MLQLTQKLGSGEMVVQDVPAPVIGHGMVLVRNYFSVISAGTEGSTVKTARKSLLGKAKERPQQVRQVLDSLKNQGPIPTYRAVKKKLDAYSPLGYSCAGEIIDIGEGVVDFKINDKVACAGAGYANHAEIIAVPVNLCVKLESGADLKQAAYNTLGAIALQGIRQADLRLGESCAIIGLGLLGQLTGIMLKASGVKVIGVDVNKEVVNVSEKYAVDYAYHREDPGLKESILRITNGIGVDAVIITAATNSLDPVNFAGLISRKKGKVIIVGAVPTGFDREPYYYRKELELKMACSYGPGRYDPNYEEKGIDYPVSYVRWTEKRNMEAFQELISARKIDLTYLTTHEFNLKDAPDAYEMVVNRSETFLGILIKYDQKKIHKNEKIQNRDHESHLKRIAIAFIGAGSYAQGYLLPFLPRKNVDISLKGVLTSSGTTSKRVAQRFGFDFCTSNLSDIMQNSDINTVFIATRHNTHAKYVLDGLINNKNIFVEKPLCLNLNELEKITRLYESKAGNLTLMVGYNRRFSPLATWLKKRIPAGPMAMIYRINAGYIPGDSWIQDPEIGGGRIIGEVCHFVDFLTYMCGSIPVRVYASAVLDVNNFNDVVNINIDFKNGSSGIIAYYSNGNPGIEKERVEVYSSGAVGILHDFKEARWFDHKNSGRKKLLNQDKGQKIMIQNFLKSLKDEISTPISFNEIYAVSKTTIQAINSISSHEAKDL